MSRLRVPLIGGATAAVTALVAASVVTPAHALTTTPLGSSGTTWRTTARNESFTDAAGVVWGSRDGTWKGSIGRSLTLNGKDVAGTTNDGLYQTGGFGVTGYVQPVISDGDYEVTLHLAEDYWNAPGKRVFDVAAEGTTMLKGVDIFKAVGANTAYSLTFTVPVTDGELNLGFVATVDRPQVAAIEVRQVGQVTSSGPGTSNPATPHLIEFSPTSFLYRDVSTAPVAGDSAALAAVLASQVKSRYGGTAAFNAYQYNTSLYRVNSTTPRTNVGYWDCQNKGYTPTNFLDGLGQFRNVPIPANAQPAVGSDGTMTVYDPTADKVWEFWHMRRNPDKGGWEACWGGRLDTASTQQGYFSGHYGATATGLVMGGGVISLDDVRRGTINHVMQLSVLDAAKGDFSWPAQRTDGTLTSGTVLTEGRRFRLDPKVDVSALGLTPIGQMVARAAQRYGFVISDKGSAVAVKTQAGLDEKATTGTDPWDRLLAGTTASKVLSGFPWDKVQFLPVDYGRP